MKPINQNLIELYELADFDYIFLIHLMSLVSFDSSVDSYDDELTSFNKTDTQRISDLLMLTFFVVVECDDFDIYGNNGMEDKSVRMTFEEFERVIEQKIFPNNVIHQEFYDNFKYDFYLEKKDGVEKLPNAIPQYVQDIFVKSKSKGSATVL